MRSKKEVRKRGEKNEWRKKRREKKRRDVMCSSSQGRVRVRVSRSSRSALVSLLCVSQQEDKQLSTFIFIQIILVIFSNKAVIKM